MVFLEHKVDEDDSRFTLTSDTDSEIKQSETNRALIKQLHAEVRQLRERAQASAEEYETSTEE